MFWFTVWNLNIDNYLKPVQNKTLKAVGLRATLPDLPMILA
jgi:hypothetical protein